MNPPLYTQAAFAAFVGVPIEQVAQWIRNGTLDSVKVGKTRLVLFTGVNQ